MERGLEELKGLEKSLEILLEHPKEFEKLVEAVKIDDARTYQAILDELKIREYCILICGWICDWVSVRICEWFCRDTKPVEVKIENIQEYAKVTTNLIKDEKMLKGLVEAYKKQDKEMWDSLIQERELIPHCVQICRWIRLQVCRWTCRVVCHSFDY